MSHELTITNGKAEMFSGQNIVPWHKLGTVVSGLLTAKEAIEKAGLDWQVEQRKVYSIANGQYKEVPESLAVTRTDNDNVLSILSKKYHPIQNSDSFDFFDEVVGSGQAIYDTAGSLGGGKRVWIMAKLKGQLFIDSRPDDVMDKNVLLVTSHDGSSALSMQIVSTRVVCQNTLSAALANATNQIKIRHTKNYETKKDTAMQALKLCNAYFNNLQGVINELANQSMNNEQMVKFVETLVPNPKGATDADEMTRTVNVRNEIVNLFDRGTGNLGIARIDALNAVTEYVDHNRATRVKAGGSKDENRFASAMFTSGAELKNRAFQLLTA